MDAQQQALRILEAAVDIIGHMEIDDQNLLLLGTALCKLREIPEGHAGSCATPGTGHCSCGRVQADKIRKVLEEKAVAAREKAETTEPVVDGDPETVSAPT
ncbi:MAG: hypothetical protein U9M92_03230 [Patescibacteria group bacterium]|nr:hypothetical protein [Patescibacteria group bacterium]